MNGKRKCTIDVAMEQKKLLYVSYGILSGCVSHIMNHVCFFFSFLKAYTSIILCYFNPSAEPVNM